MAKKSGVADAEAVQLLPPGVDDQVIAETIADLKSVMREGVLETAINMGKVVVDRLFGGDLDSWRERGEADQSYRKLVEALAADDDPVLTISASSVSRAIGVYDLEQRIGVSALKRITATHCYAVLGLPDKKQQALLKQADESGMSTRELEAKAQALRKKDGEKRGRPPLPRFQKSMNRLATLLKNKSESFGDLDEEHLKTLDAERAQKLYKTAKEMKRELDILQRALKSGVPDFTPDDEASESEE